MRRAPYEPILSQAFSHVSPCYAYRDQRAGENDAAYVARLAAELEAEFQRLGPDTVIAFCAETVVGVALGCATALPEYFRAMRQVCDRHGALLILDEVMSGMGRTGTLHAWEQEGSEHLEQAFDLYIFFEAEAHRIPTNIPTVHSTAGVQFPKGGAQPKGWMTCVSHKRFIYLTVRHSQTAVSELSKCE